MRGASGVLVALAVLEAAVAAPLGAQTQPSTLTITGGASSTFPSPSAADFLAPWFYNPTPLTFAASIHRNGGSGTTRVVTVELCATNATLGNGKALTDLEFSPVSTTSYRAITNNCAAGISAQRVVVSQSLTTDASGNASVSDGVLFRMHLNVGDAGPTYGTAIQLIYTVVKP